VKLDGNPALGSFPASGNVLKPQSPRQFKVGVLGLGLMGTSIATCLLAAGHPVVGVEAKARRRKGVRRQVLALLKELEREGLLKSEPASVIERLSVSSDCEAFRMCGLVIESITESVAAKKRALQRIEEVVSARALIGSNTSAIPITGLQQGALHADRIMGIHWAEPAHVTRFMEIVCGKQTRLACAEAVADLARRWWGKEPSLVRRDVRGFITNRICYAMFREAIHLVESGVATIADVDQSVRNDVGYWSTFAGPFRFMDLTGVPAYETVMHDLLSDLSCSKKVPRLIKKIVSSGGQGVFNGKGFYRYTPAEARRWQKRFLEFSYDVRKLAMKYAEERRRTSG